MEYLVSSAYNNKACFQELLDPSISQRLSSFFFFFFLLSINIVDPSKDAPFKVAPSKWEAVDEAELESQGEAF